MDQQPSVAEQIEEATKELPADTVRASKLALLSSKEVSQALTDGHFEGEALTEPEVDLLVAMHPSVPSEEADSDAALLAMADAALQPMDNPMDPQGESSSDLSDEDKAKIQEDLRKQNRATLKNNRRAAKEWIDKKAGQGILIGSDMDGTMHCLVLGDEAELAEVSIQVDNPLYRLVLGLVISHLPGASVNSRVMHAQQLEALNNVANNLMAGLQATNNNVLTLVNFLKLKFPELNANVTSMAQTKSGILVPGA